MESVTNLFACLVHENFECVVDLLRNLKYFDPRSPILLYDGSANRRLLPQEFPFERYRATIIPESKPLPWGRLHDFALDCFQYAIRNYNFLTLTIVDSDQLLIRNHYSDFIEEWLQDKSGVGLLGSSEKQFGTHTSQFVTRVVQAEMDLWGSFVERFGGDLGRSVRWSFWPATVFTYEAVRDICRVLLYEPQLREILNRTRVHATEEVVFPTLVALLGYQIEENPCAYQFVKYRVSYTPDKLVVALGTPNVYWVHPVARRYNDPIRKAVRNEFNHYEASPGLGGTLATSREQTMLLTLPILNQMRKIEGWLDDEEADLLIAATTRAAGLNSGEQAASIVEVGSYCAKSTVVLGLTLKSLGRRAAKVYAIDPHEGKVGAYDHGITQLAPTFERFRRNIQEAGVAELIEPIKAYSFDVTWNKPIAFLFIDGLHDYPNVARDFHHFAYWILPGGLVAFHDYADYYPGVKKFVDELLNLGEYHRLEQVKSLVLLEKKQI